MTCTECDAGYRCPYAHLSPIICIRGTYSEAGWTSCQACVAGEYANSTGKFVLLVMYYLDDWVVPAVMCLITA